MTYDAVVLGLGGMGSAALAHMARRGKRVLGIEQFACGHDRGASAGNSRIIRMAYYEDPAYVPLLRRAYELWLELETTAGQRLLDLCGVLMAGHADSSILAGAQSSAHLHGIAVEELSARQIAGRYPALRLLPGERALFEPNAGMVFPEAAINAHLRAAEDAGAEMRFESPVVAFTALPDAIRVDLADESCVHARRLAICAGPWFADVARELALPLIVQRNVQLWFAPSVEAYGRDRFPAFFLDRAGAPAPLYGFPDYGLGVKAALHGYGATTSAAQLDRDIGDADLEPLRRALDGFMPGAATTMRAGKACMYALTPDRHFVIDVHPGDPRIVVAGGFSGHGYKFCPVVGEIVADLALDGATRHPIDFLRLDRPALRPPDPAISRS